MPTETLELAKKLIAAEDALDNLWEATKSAAKRKKIDAQIKVLRKQIAALVGQAIDESTAEYQAATAKLAEASSQIKKAIADIKKFEEAIAAIAQAAALVAAVAAAA